MTDGAATETPTTETTPPATGDEVLGEAGIKALEAERREKRAAEKRASELEARLKEFEAQQKAAMTDAERALVEAESRGRTAAATEFGKELAQTQFDALAGRRNPGFNTADALAFVDLAKFLGEDGRPDMAQIQAAVERLVPAPTEGVPSFDGGTRTPPPAPTDMSGLIRKAAGRA